MSIYIIMDTEYKYTLISKANSKLISFLGQIYKISIL